jgi:hypothetical protein
VLPRLVANGTAGWYSRTILLVGGVTEVTLRSSVESVGVSATVTREDDDYDAEIT